MLRNVGAIAKYFPLEEPILCVGSGDGTEVLAWGVLGYDVCGIDISKRKSGYANIRGASTYCADAEEGISIAGHNIYCAHTLEHMQNPQRFIDHALQTAISTLCFIIPIEVNGTRNPSHLHPFSSLNGLGITMGKVIYKTEHYNDEPEGIMVIKL